MAFEDLDVWKRASTLSADIYIEMQKIRDYGFRDQITRSGLSVPSNIAEGVDRSSAKETMNFLSYAKGSCVELRTQILIKMKIGYISKDIGINWANETREISAMLVGLSKTIKNQ